MCGNSEEFHTFIIHIKMLHQTVKKEFLKLNSVLVESLNKQLQNPMRNCQNEYKSRKLMIFCNYTSMKTPFTSFYSRIRSGGVVM